jgi:hypothetical protein
LPWGLVIVIVVRPRKPDTAHSCDDCDRDQDAERSSGKPHPIGALRPADVTALVFVGEDADHTAVVSDMLMDII